MNVASLTADGAVGFVCAVSAAVSSRTGDRARPAPPVAASEGAVAAPESSSRPSPADVRRFVAAIAAAHNGVAELVFGDALAVGALERVRRTTSLPNHLQTKPFANQEVSAGLPCTWQSASSSP